MRRGIVVNPMVPDVNPMPGSRVPTEPMVPTPGVWPGGGPNVNPGRVGPMRQPFNQGLPDAYRNRRILSMKKGGKVKRTGLYKLHKGERVLAKTKLSALKGR